MTHRRKQTELQTTTTQDYWRELEELQQLSSIVLNDLHKLRLEPSISSSTRNMRKINKIMSKAEEQIETLRKWHARQHARHRSKHTPAPWPDMGKTEKVNPVHYQQMQQFTNDVLDAIDRGQELHLPIQRKPSKHQHESWCQRSHLHVIPTIEHWQDQLTSLQGDFNVHWDNPWKPETVNVMSTIAASNPIQHNTKAPRLEHLKMVSHFQTLFDVPTEEGVYTRMNDVYVRLAEMQNIYHSLKCKLGLSDDTPISSVVGAVNRLCELHSGTTAQLLSQLMQDESLDRLITRLDHYHKFFPVFDGMARELMEILGVSSMSQVVPAVKALKLLNP